MSPERVLAEHSSRGLSDWMAYDLAVGLGRDEDQRAGIVAAAFWNSQGGIPVAKGSKERRAAKPEDFFPHLAVEEQTATTHDAEPDEASTDGSSADDAEAATQAMKNAWAMWGIRQNAALRAAQSLDTGEPPDDPESN